MRSLLLCVYETGSSQTGSRTWHPGQVGNLNTKNTKNSIRTLCLVKLPIKFKLLQKLGITHPLEDMEAKFNTVFFFSVGIPKKH